MILGGGIAGVTAAYTLQSNGMEDFLLLEASDRLGGRIKNSTFCGTLHKNIFEPLETLLLRSLVGTNDSNYL